MEPQVAQSARRYDTELVALAHGVAVWLGAGPLPASAASNPAVVRWIEAAPDALADLPADLVVDSFVSSGALWSVDDLVATLVELRRHVGPTARLAFCEPTVDALHGRDRPGVRHDVTESLWAAGWTPEDWRRFTIAGQWGIPWSFVKGTARLTLAPVAPPA